MAEFGPEWSLGLDLLRAYRIFAYIELVAKFDEQIGLVFSVEFPLGAFKGSAVFSQLDNTLAGSMARYTTSAEILFGSDVTQ